MTAPSARPVGAALSWRALLTRLLAGQSLEAEQTAWAMDEIMSGEATAAQLAAFAVLLRAKGETPEEIGGLVRTMLARAPRVEVGGRAVDIVGTGGDGAQTVNISTMAALVVAGSGRRVVKHGNRAATSACGSADVLERLGVVIDLPPAGVAATVAQAGIGFCFAPVFHAGMRFAGAPRRELGVPTFFNFLGPLTNPGRPPAAAVGCADRALAPTLAAVFAQRGDSALVVRGDDGLDELTTTTTTSAWVATGGDVRPEIVDPGELGLAPARPEQLRGGDAAHNAAAVDAVLSGGGGSVRDAVLLNAAAGIAAYDDDLAGPLPDALSRGLAAARESVDSGAAADLLRRWVTASKQAAAEHGTALR